ncbi:uncharacterized protein LOC114770512 isoform X2 [Denticeps clupeoides]|uniref:uncharacterized protein LOC114770512 isoform X2 n=1 Tax=Denticeps clupeoides TaxID=299321 RepID=UPI0010A35FA8|nr:uncharacterized protein LOC114770512 isoform X2 [Denticeps clupeoides]
MRVWTHVRRFAKVDAESVNMIKLATGSGCLEVSVNTGKRKIVQENPSLKDFLVKWPALQIESQVCAEFHRITNTNLRNQFYAELDRHTPQLFALYRQKASHTGKVSEVLRDILRIYDREDMHDINIKRTVVLRALAVYLREDDPQFFKTWNVKYSVCSPNRISFCAYQGFFYLSFINKLP